MFWRSAQAQQAPSMMPPLSLESFLADPTPVPSPQGAVPFTTGNVEMWPPPNCEDVLPPVGGQLSVPRHDMAMPCWAMPAMPADMPPMGMPAMPAGMPPTGMPAMPAGMPPTGMPAMPAMPLSGGVEHFAVASQPAAMAFASTAASNTVVTGASIPGVASTLSSSTMVAAGNTGTNVIAWMDTGSKPTSTGRRCSSYMPNLPPTAAPATAATAATAAEVVGMGKLPPTWTSTVDPEAPEEDPLPETMELSGSGEMMQEAEDKAQADEESTREDLLSKLKLAKQALLWERAVTQRLRSQLDMAEAWSPPDSEEEVLTLKAQMASLLEENRKLKEEAEASSSDSSDGEETEALQAEVRDAQAELEVAQEKLKAGQEQQRAADEQVAAAKAEADALRKAMDTLETEKAAAAEAAQEEAKVIRGAVEELKKKLQELLKDGEERSAKEAAQRGVEEDLREQLRKMPLGASNYENGEEDLREQLRKMQEMEEDLRAQLRKMEAGASDHETVAEDLRAQLRKMEAGASDKDKVEEDLRVQLQKMEAGASDHETVAEDLRAQLRKMEAGASEKEKVEEDLRVQLRKMEAGASDHETVAEDLRAQLRKMEAGASDKDRVEENLRVQLQKMEAGASDHETVAEDLRAQLRKMEADASDKDEVEEDLRAQLREMEAGASEKDKVEDGLRTQLRKMEAGASDRENVEVQLRHVQTRNAELENELQEFQQVQLRKAKLKDVDVAVQTDFAEPEKPEKGVRSARTKKKSVFFNTAPGGSESSIPGAVEHAVSETRSQRAHFKSVDFGQHDEDVSYTPMSSSEDDDDGTMSAMTSRTSMMSQTSEYYDMYNETSRPALHRARSELESYSEEDLWDPEHVARVTRKLFPKHDKDRTGRIDWASGEAKKFLEEFFWLHKQPPPKIPNAPFQSLYDQVKTENDGYHDDTDDKGLNVEEMTAFAIKVHQFVYKQLGKEMRAQRKSFAVTEEELATLHRASIEMHMGEDAQATAARMLRPNTIMATPDLSGLTEKE